MSKEVYAVCDRCGGKVPDAGDFVNDFHFHGIKLCSMEVTGDIREDYEICGLEEGFALLCQDCEKKLADFINGEEVPACAKK